MFMSEGFTVIAADPCLRQAPEPLFLSHTPASGHVALPLCCPDVALGRACTQSGTNEVPETVRTHNGSREYRLEISGSRETL